jgi:linoleoyl-CoA desaturase
VSGSFWFAIFGWLMGALGHDAGHFAVSRAPFLNEWGVWSMSMICNPILWQHQHTYGHHSFTNDFDHDPDLHHFEVLLRVHKKFPHENFYQRQSNFAYVMFAYFFVVFGTAIWIPWGMIQSGTLYGIIEWQDKERPTKAMGMRLHLFLYVVLIVIVPFWTHRSFWTAALAVYVHIATIGLVFALFSQINHLNEASIERGDDNVSANISDPRVVGSWAADQVETSNNFCSQSFLWHVLSNGLNHQIEHHLFPGLNHCHLHLIAPVVQQTCEEFGVNYKSYKTWRELLGATLEWFEKLSVDDEKVQASEEASPQETTTR